MAPDLELQPARFRLVADGYDRQDVDRFAETVAAELGALRGEGAYLRTQLALAREHLAALEADAAPADALLARAAVVRDEHIQAGRDARDAAVRSAAATVDTIGEEAAAQAAFILKDLVTLEKERWSDMRRLSTHEVEQRTRMHEDLVALLEKLDT